MNFQYAVKKVRKHLNLSQMEFAQALKVSFATINRWENGKTTPNNLAMDAFRRFCENENIDISEF
jgi:putative transcriptional regulator